MGSRGTLRNRFIIAHVLESLVLLPFIALGSVKLRNNEAFCSFLYAEVIDFSTRLTVLFHSVSKLSTMLTSKQACGLEIKCEAYLNPLQPFYCYCSCYQRMRHTNHRNIN